MDNSITRRHEKPANTPANHYEQKPLPLVGEVSATHELAPWIVDRMCFMGAINQCIYHDGRSAQAIARSIGTSKGYLSKLLNGLWAEQWARMRAFMRETNCAALLQRMAADLGYGIYRLESCQVKQLASLQARVTLLAAQLEQQRRSA